MKRPQSTKTAGTCRPLERGFYRTSKQDKQKRFYSLYDKVWRVDVLWETWRQIKANRGASGIVFVTLAIGRDALGTDEPNVMARCLDRSCPVMGTTPDLRTD